MPERIGRARARYIPRRDARRLQPLGKGTICQCLLVITEFINDLACEFLEGIQTTNTRVLPRNGQARKDDLAHKNLEGLFSR